MSNTARIFWPDCWKYNIASEGGGTKYFGGSRLRISASNGHKVTYCCSCGEELERIIGENILGTQLWVATHAKHLPLDERVDNDNWK